VSRRGPPLQDARLDSEPGLPPDAARETDDHRARHLRATVTMVERAAAGSGGGGPQRRDLFSIQLRYNHASSCAISSSGGD
jgi:hypothetical protein